MQTLQAAAHVQAQPSQHGSSRLAHELGHLVHQILGRQAHVAVAPALDSQRLQKVLVCVGPDAKSVCASVGVHLGLRAGVLANLLLVVHGAICDEDDDRQGMSRSLCGHRHGVQGRLADGLPVCCDEAIGQAVVVTVTVVRRVMPCGVLAVSRLS